MRYLLDTTSNSSKQFFFKSSAKRSKRRKQIVTTVFIDVYTVHQLEVCVVLIMKILRKKEQFDKCREIYDCSAHTQYTGKLATLCAYSMLAKPCVPKIAVLRFLANIFATATINIFVQIHYPYAYNFYTHPFTYQSIYCLHTIVCYSKLGLFLFVKNFVVQLVGRGYRCRFLAPHLRKNYAPNQNLTPST